MIRQLIIVAAAATAGFGVVASARGGRPMRSELAPLTVPGRLSVDATAEPEREPRQTQRAQPRNVVIILSDDHRYDFMSFMPGAPRCSGRQLDRMRREGATSATPSCDIAMDVATSRSARAEERSSARKHPSGDAR